ncbi:MAG: PIG-L deacetylase family protein [Actinomycetota bacterium]
MKSRSTLVVAAHPDDEVLGCGGTIHRLAQSGTDVNIVFLSDGVSSRSSNEDNNKMELDERRKSAIEASKILGANTPTFHDFPDNQLDTVPLLGIVKLIETEINRYGPDTVITHFGNDLNIDHRIASEAVIVACRPQNSSPVKRVLFFEIPSSTEWQMENGQPTFSPNYFIDISEHLEFKLRALHCYSTELRTWPHSRSLEAVEHLCRWRGASVGTTAAEAFVLGRQIS